MTPKHKTDERPVHFVQAPDCLHCIVLAVIGEWVRSHEGQRASKDYVLSTLTQTTAEFVVSQVEDNNELGTVQANIIREFPEQIQEALAFQQRSKEQLS